jgi:hypothetical protein
MTTASSTSGRRIDFGTKIPDDLEHLTHSRLVRLLQKVSAERDAVAEEYFNLIAPPSVNVEALKKRMVRQAIAKIKKTGHSNRKRPWTELVFGGIPSEDYAKALFEDCDLENETSRMITWELTDRQELIDFFGEVTVDPVKFDGFYRPCPLTGRRTPPYSYASFERMVAKYDKGQKVVNLKIRTFLVQPRFG